MWSEEAELLVYGTGMVESHYEALYQIGMPTNGGLSFWQLEPSDFKDLGIWLRNGFCKGMLDRVLSACYFTSFPVDATVLASNIKFAALMCRVHYWRIKEPIPKGNNAAALSAYHKRYYNAGGKAEVDVNTKIFQQIIDGEL
ncbi:MAG: hypothetical protein ACRDE5_03610 [Ginsengibacter sp.]